jgi:hypothetical protein
VSATIRAGGNNVPVRDGHIRFEDVTELLPKSSAVVEEVSVHISYCILLK